MRRRDHENHCGQDDRGSNHGAQRDGLPDDEPAQEQRHDWIHKRIRCHARRGALLKNVDVRAKTNSRPKYDEVAERKPGAKRNRAKMQTAKFSSKESGDQQNHSPCEALHRNTQQRRSGHSTVL